MSKAVQGELTKDIISGPVIVVLIFLISIFLPIIGFFFSFLIPLPILFYRAKLGRANGIIIPVFAIILMVIILGGLTFDTAYFVGLVLIGFSLSEFIEKNLSVERTVLYACTFVLAGAVVGLFFFSSISGTSVSALISDYLRKNFELTIALYEELGMPEEIILMMSNAMGKIHYFVWIIPALVTTFTLIVAWISLLLARPILKNKHLFFPDFGSLNLWKAPEYLVWGVIGCGVLLFVPNTAVKIVAINGMIVLLTIYFFQGIAIVSFFLEKKRLPRMLKVFIYCFIAMQQVFLIMVVGVGFFDIWLNFRKLGTNYNNDQLQT